MEVLVFLICFDRTRHDLRALDSHVKLSGSLVSEAVCSTWGAPRSLPHAVVSGPKHETETVEALVFLICFDRTRHDLRALDSHVKLSGSLVSEAV